MPPPAPDLGRARLEAAAITARAERNLDRAVTTAMGAWLTALRVELLREARMLMPGLTAAAYPQWPFAVDEAAQRSWNAWVDSTNNNVLPEVRVAFGEAFQRLRRTNHTSSYQAELDHMATVFDRLKIWPEGAFEDIRPELLEALAEAESFDEIRDRIARVLDIDKDTRAIRAQIGDVDKRIADPTLDGPELARLRAERRALWRQHDRSLSEWQWKARRIARTEGHGAVSAGQLAKAKAVEEATGERLFKRWLATNDMRVRPTHAIADGQVVPLREKFRVGGFLLSHPADPIEVAPHEVINCRCTMLIYDNDELQMNLQGEHGSVGEIRPGGVRIGPDDPDDSDAAVREWAESNGRSVPSRLGERGEDHGQSVTGEQAPQVDPDHVPEQPIPDLSEVSDQELADYLADHTFDDDALFDQIMAEVDSRLDDDDVDLADDDDDVLDHKAVQDWLDAESQWERDVDTWLDAEDDWHDQVTRWLDEERNWRYHVDEWLQAEQDWQADPLPSLPHKVVRRDLSDPLQAQFEANEDFGHANPNYYKGEEWRVNCQRVVQALELRRRGYDVAAQPSDPNATPTPPKVFDAQRDDWVKNRTAWTKAHGAEALHFNDLWRHHDGSMSEFSRVSQVDAKLFGAARATSKAIMDTAPVGGRGWVTVDWKGSTSRHIFSWEVVEVSGAKVVRYYDAQNGMGDCSDYFDDVEPNLINWMRVDNLMPTPRVADLVDPRA